MKTAIYTFTRDRLDYTQRTFESMRSARPGARYDHWVFDQGSEDQTLEWLYAQQAEGRLHRVIPWNENLGLHVGKNLAHDIMFSEGEYTHVMKVDNDMEFKTKGWLKKLLRAQGVLGAGAVVSPRIKGLKHPPPPWGRKVINGIPFSFVDILGGAARLTTVKTATAFRYNERMPMAMGAASSFAAWCINNAVPMAYVESVVVKHMDTTEGQEQALPAYFRRSFYERHVPYGL